MMLDLQEQATPEALRLHAERQELFRIAALGMLANPRLDPLSRPWAQQMAALPVLPWPLSDGVPECK